MNMLKIPLVIPSGTADGVSVWEWCGSALDEGADASNWFSKYLGKPSELVRLNQVREEYTNNRGYIYLSIPNSLSQYMIYELFSML